MGQGEHQKVLVRCQCGKKYRVRSTADDAGFVCKSCGQTIRLTTQFAALSLPQHWTQTLLWMVWAIPACIFVAGILYIVIRETEPRSIEEPLAASKSSSNTHQNRRKLLPESSDINSSNAEKPPLLTAPFESRVAKKHQQIWSDYLGLPVELTIDLSEKQTITFVLVPPGEFNIGSSEAEQALVVNELENFGEKYAAPHILTEGPQHSVQISDPFYIGKFEVNQAQWQAVMDSNPSGYLAEKQPVESVNLRMIDEMLRRLNQQQANRKMHFSLPTEAQWEYACRAGTETAWYTGDAMTDLQSAAWIVDNSHNQGPSPVGAFEPNAWNIFDMHGNVAECCKDRYVKKAYTAAVDPEFKLPNVVGGRVLRGGNWASSAYRSRSAYRADLPPNVDATYIGFRLAINLD